MKHILLRCRVTGRQHVRGVMFRGAGGSAPTEPSCRKQSRLPRLRVLRVWCAHASVPVKVCAEISSQMKQHRTGQTYKTGVYAQSAKVQTNESTLPCLVCVVGRVWCVVWQQWVVCVCVKVCVLCSVKVCVWEVCVCVLREY